VEAKGLHPKRGDSVAVNGVCLTVTQINRKRGRSVLSFDLSLETLQKTTLKHLKAKTTVNLEPALKLSDALGGHIVQGHVDGVGKITKIVNQKDMKVISFQAAADIMATVVEKGSVTVDGVSLTAIHVTKNGFSVALIPYTLQHTNLMTLKKGDHVNLEADIIGKYIQKFLKKI
jgi:riboflavin synthase